LAKDEVNTSLHIVERKVKITKAKYDCELLAMQILTYVT